MKVNEKKILQYNSILIFAYLFAAGLLLAVKGPGARVFAALALPLPFVLWCVWYNLRRDRLFFVYLLIFATVLTPDIRLGGLPALRIEQALVLAALAWGAIRLLISKVYIHLSLFVGMLAAFSGFVFISTLAGSLSGFRASINDLFEVYKIVIYLGVFCVTATATISQLGRERILRFCNFCIALSGLIAISQYVNPLGLNNYYVPKIAPTQFTTLVGGYFSPRVVGLANNPNIYAAIAAIGVIISLVLVMRTRKIYHLGFGFISGLGLLMTKSRTGIIFLAVMALVLFFLFFADKIIVGRKIRLRPLVTMIVLLCVAALAVPAVFLALPESLTWRFREIANIAASGSWQERMTHWQENIQYFSRSPYLGIGAGKSVGFKYAPDNEWLLLLRKYGLLGTTWFFLTFALPVFIYRKYLKRSLLTKMYISILMGLAVYMLPAAAFHSFQLMPLVMVLGGLVFSLLPNRIYKVALTVQAGPGATEYNRC
jgi:hypothetical protein